MKDGPGPLGVLLSQCRTAAGLSQDELAELSGLSRRGISNLEPANAGFSVVRAAVCLIALLRHQVPQGRRVPIPAVV